MKNHFCRVINLIVGLTGGIACGKTFCSDYLGKLGAKIIDADVVARGVLERQQPAWHEAVAAFGVQILTADGSINRRLLRERVFNNECERQKLNAITHPRIRHNINCALRQKTNAPYIVLSAALLLENKLHELTKLVVVVDALPQQQLRRACRRDKQQAAIISAIMARQFSREKKFTHANYVIDNKITTTHTCKQLDALHNIILNLRDCAVA